MNRKMRSLHRSVGIIAALTLLLLAITGILLNHTQKFKFDEQYLNWNWLLKLYGQADLSADAVFIVDSKVISQLGNQVFVDAVPVTYTEQTLLGGIAFESYLLIATESVLLLLDQDGQLIERMGSSAGVPINIQQIGLYQGLPVIQTTESYWRSDPDINQWEQISSPAANWSEPDLMPANIKTSLESYFYGEGVSLERVILDLHNGRILGSLGTWLLDVFGLLLILLSLTGLWMWSRKRT